MQTLPQFISSTLNKFGAYSRELAEVIYIPTQKRRVKPWFEDKGDKTLRLNYDNLNEQSIVFDLGGYEGQWASDIFAKYKSNVFIFEPNLEYAKGIENRFSKNPKIKIYSFGLSNNTREEQLSILDDASSTFKTGSQFVKINLVKAIDFLKDHDISVIDLMKINIEGGEYDLLEHLIETKAISRVKNIQVQFHDFVSNAKDRMQNIQGELAKTHFLTYQYEFVWENWCIKEDKN